MFKKALTALTLAAFGLPASAAQDAPVLVELFTSQGCYSCPPADRLLGELAERDDVVALAFHVTYWDRLGWRDTFGKSISNTRQYAYGQQFQASSVYTPQAVIAGEIDVVGSNERLMETAIDLVQTEGQAKPLRVSEDGHVDLSRLEADPGVNLWMAVYARQRDVVIERGENRGKTLPYHQIVRVFEDLGPLSAQTSDLVLDVEEYQARGLDGLVVVAQSPANGQIWGVGELAW